MAIDLRKYRKIDRHLFTIVLFSTVLSGCVSSTLESNQFRAVGADTPTSVSINGTTANSKQPVELTGTPTANTADPADAELDREGADPAARAAAVQEMRAKGEQTSSEKTHIGALPETATEQLTPEQQRAKAAELKQTVTEAQATVSDQEIQSKHNSIQQLRRRAKSHYSDAVKRIEN